MLYILRFILFWFIIATIAAYGIYLGCMLVGWKLYVTTLIGLVICTAVLLLLWVIYPHKKD